MSVPVGRLQSLKLKGMLAPSKDYLALLLQHCGALEELGVTCASVTSTENWGAILSCMLERMHLQRLEIHTLDTRCSSCPGDCDNEGSEMLTEDVNGLGWGWAWEGLETIHEGVQSLLANREMVS